METETVAKNGVGWRDGKAVQTGFCIVKQHGGISKLDFLIRK